METQQVSPHDLKVTFGRLTLSYSEELRNYALKLHLSRWLGGESSVELQVICYNLQDEYLYHVTDVQEFYVVLENYRDDPTWGYPELEKKLDERGPLAGYEDLNLYVTIWNKLERMRKRRELWWKKEWRRICNLARRP
jgi:hypothetical protein